MNPTSSFAEAARRALDILYIELQKYADDDNFIEPLEDFMDNNEVDEEEYHKYLDFSHGDEDCAIFSHPQEITLLMLPLMMMTSSNSLTTLLR
jgi:hypothetical protein